MTFEQAIIFLLFVVCNSYFMYRSGFKQGQFLGMVNLSILLNNKSLLKDKDTVIGYDSIPFPVRCLLEKPQEVLEESTNG